MQSEHGPKLPPDLLQARVAAAGAEALEHIVEQVNRGKAKELWRVLLEEAHARLDAVEAAYAAAGAGAAGAAGRLAGGGAAEEEEQQQPSSVGSEGMEEEEESAAANGDAAASAGRWTIKRTLRETLRRAIASPTAADDSASR